MLKVAGILGVQQALVEGGFLRPYASLEKAAQAATVASQAIPQEVQAAGEFITPQDLASLEKILAILSELQAMYQESQGGAPGGAPGMGMPPPQGGAPGMGMPPPPPQGGAPGMGMPPPPLPGGAPGMGMPPGQ